MIEYIDFLPSNFEVPREDFFPAIWQGKQGWTNGHIMTTLLPSGVDRRYPDADEANERTKKAYKKPVDGDRVQHEKTTKIVYSRFKHAGRFLNIELKNGDKAAIIDSIYYQMIIGMYGFDLDFYYGRDNLSAVSVYKKDVLVALIMPLRKW